MNGMNRMLRGMALAALAAASLLSQAAPVVSVNPASQTINIGDTASVDIIVSGLTDPTGGFSLTLDFNDSFLKAISYLNDPDAKMGAAPLDMSGGFSGGSLDLFFVADATETEASLAAAQGASFTLATISFEGLANGLSPLKLSNVVLSNWDGTETLRGRELQQRPRTRKHGARGCGSGCPGAASPPPVGRADRLSRPRSTPDPANRKAEGRQAVLLVGLLHSCI